MATRGGTLLFLALFGCLYAQARSLGEGHRVEEQALCVAAAVFLVATVLLPAVPAVRRLRAEGGAYPWPPRDVRVRSLLFAAMLVAGLVVAGFLSLVVMLAAVMVTIAAVLMAVWHLTSPPTSLDPAA
jgi:hypothetical protein